MDIVTLQQKLPWGRFYSAQFKALDLPYKDFQHALAHIAKASGKLFAMIDDADHGDGFFPEEDVKKYLADLVICAMRAANVNPSGGFDLGEAVIRRIEEKNGVKLV